MNINNVFFNNINNLITCAGDLGFSIYRMNPELEKTVEKNIGGLSIMKIYNKTNIVAFVGGGTNPYKSKDCVVLYDMSSDSDLTDIDVKEPIKNILLCDGKLVVSVVKKIYLFDWQNTPEMTNYKETFYNDNGLCVLNENTKTILTLGKKKGDISLWNYETKTHQDIEAHKTSVEAIAISEDGRYVASASETGTLVRVFDVEEPNKPKYEFRRGSQQAGIYSICFSKNKRFLACSSSNGTVHIFDLQDITKNTQSYLSGLKNYLPGYFGSQWSFKQYYIGNGSKSICCFDDDGNIHLANVDGEYHKIPYQAGDFKEIISRKLI